MNTVEKAVKMIEWCSENDYWSSFSGENKVLVIHPSDNDLERWVIDLKDNSLKYGIKIGNFTWVEEYVVTEDTRTKFEHIHKEHIDLLNAFRTYILDGYKRLKHEMIDWCDFSLYTLYFHTDTVKIESVYNSYEWILINLTNKKISLYSFDNKKLFGKIEEELRERGVLA